MDDQLRAELLRRAEQDQHARTADPARLSQVDANNLAWLQPIIRERGWPTRSMVGEEASGAAWLLVQHADQDPAFQRYCLTLLTDAAAEQEASLREVAYLADRVLLAEGRMQEFGTQAWSGTAGSYRARCGRRRASTSGGPPWGLSRWTSI